MDGPTPEDKLDHKVVELMKCISDVDELFRDVVSWSRLTETCSSVLLDNSSSDNGNTFSDKKTQELQRKAEELKAKLEDSVKLIDHINENCPHLDGLQDAADKIKMFSSYTDALEKQADETDVRPIYLREIHVLSGQLEKQLNAATFDSEDLERSLDETADKDDLVEENIFEQLALFDEWIDGKHEALISSMSYGALPETAQEYLDKHMLFIEEIEDKEDEIKKFLSDQAIDNSTLEPKLEALKAAADARKQKLTEALKEATAFHENLQTFMDWLDEAERKLKSTNKMPISVLPEKVTKQIADHAQFEESFKDRRLELLELDKMGARLKYFAQKQDGILIKNLLLSTHSRWDKLLSGATAYTSTINDLSKKAYQFSETSSELMDWIRSATIKLESDIPHHVEDNDSAEAKAYEDFQKAVTSKQPVYNSVARSGTMLLEKATLFNDKAEIDRILNELKKEWTDLKQNSIKRKQQLENSLIFSENLSDAINSEMEWLLINDPSLTDTRVFGDINTVQMLITKHDILKNELEERRGTIEELQQSLRAEQGDDWENVPMQELITKWNDVSTQADAKQDLLNSAEKQAEDLHASTDKLLSHLAKVESDLYSNSKLPQDDFQLQELKLSHQATVADLSEKEKEFDRIINLANDILEKAHPDAVIPIRQLIKVLQSKWFEIQVKSNDHTIQIEDTIEELEEDFQLIDKLKKWLTSTEQQLKEQSEQPLTPENIAFFTDELQAYQDEMTAQQPGYDKLISRYTTRRAQPTAKKSPRGKATKREDEPESGIRLDCEKLQTQWNNVWLTTLERQKRLQETPTTNTAKDPQTGKGKDFDFEKWRKKFMRWLKSRKLKPMEFFRAMDKDLDGTITRQEFMDGLQHSNMPIKESEIKKVCDYFEQESDGVDYYKLVAALYPAKDMMKHEKEADQIENEVVRQVAKCTCCKRFNVQQIAENKYRFGDNQQMRLVRILKSTVMVRVGGGWMALDEFLVKNDPCRAKKRTNTELREKFLSTQGTSHTMSPFRTKRSPTHRPKMS